MYRAGRLCRRQCLRCKLLRLPHRARTRRVDTLVGVSRFICQRHLAHGYFQRVRSIKVIPNARDTAGETIPATPREDDGLTVYGYIGRLSPSKGVELLLETFSRNCRDSWRLLLAGTGEADYEKHLRQRFAHPQIEFLGQIKAENFYPRLDCTVAPSLWEDTFPSVVFESLLYGRPVLGSDLGGIPEMINPGNGRFFAGGDSADLCRALMEMAAAKPAFRDRFYAIQHGAARYCDTEGWLNIWEETFREAVEAQRERKMS
jgi:glycosyltransferase involved in cell wall biosynthesis